MTVPYLVSKTFDILIGKLKRIYSSLSTETLDIDVVLKESDVPNTMELIINHEDDTIGNILQSHFHNEYYRTGKEVQELYKLQFVGYYCPHPLDPNVVVKMTLTSSADNNSDNITPDIIFRSFLKKGITEIIESFEAYQSEWHSFTGYVPIVNEIMPVPENAEIENGKADEME
jgi:DNA-directed RNA polymerase subunit L